MRKRRTTSLGFAALACATALLAGCTPQTNGPPIEGPESTEERTYAKPIPEQPASSTPANACANSGDGLRQPVWTDSGSVNVNISRVFAGDPDMDDVSYDDSKGDGWENYSHDFDPKRLIIVALKSSNLPLKGDDLTSFTFQRTERKNGFTTCESPLDTDVRFIGARDAGDGLSASIWEVKSDDDFFDSDGFGRALLDIRQAHIEGMADRYVKRPERVESERATAPRRAPAFDDLQFYFKNR